MVKKLSFGFIFLSLSIFSIFAEQDVGIKISANKYNVIEDEVFKISIAVSGASNDIKIMDIKKTDPAIVIQYSGTMSNISIINGVMTSALTLTFYGKISKPGEFDIGPFALKIKNIDHTTDIIKINVTASPDQQQEKALGKNISSDRSQFYLLELNSSKKTVYVNEFFDVKINFYNRAGIRNENYKKLVLPTIAWVERLPVMENVKKVRKNNYIYVQQEVEKQRVFIPKSGTYTITPAVLNFIGVTSLSFFTTYEPIVLKTPTLTLNVKPLPDNPPKGFDGAVGVFKLHSSLSPTKLKVKEPVTLKITLEGEGNFQNIKDIGYYVDDSIEVYSSKSSFDTKNEIYKIKKWEILLVPSKPGKHKIKLNGFSYFDINHKKYLSIGRKFYTLDVTKGKYKKAEDEYTFIHDAGDKNKIGEFNEIRYIKLKLSNKKSIFRSNYWCKCIIFIYIFIFACIILFVVIKYLAFSNLNKMSFIREKSAYKNFIKNINSLKKNINKTSSKKGIDTISNIVETYFIWKFNIDSIEFTNRGIQDKLDNYLSSDDIKVLKDIIAQLDMIRFGGHEITQHELLEFVNRISDYIKRVEFKENE